MKLSEILFSRTKRLWHASAAKPFVMDMVIGTLDDLKFRQYTLQDYLYLLDYIEILDRLRGLAQNDEVTDFLCRIIEETSDEAKRVHLPNIKKMGIRAEEITRDNELGVVSDYVDFMRRCIDDKGLLGGLTALLQCSWVYAYTAETLMRKYPEEIAVSKYRFWFESYSCQSYLDANRMWIDTLDKQSAGIDKDMTEKLCRIFEKCALYENSLWDALYVTHS